jgi:hypothetical protein
MKDEVSTQVKHFIATTNARDPASTKYSMAATLFGMALADGTYEVIVVEVDERDDGALVLELAVSSGDMRGEVVRLVATNMHKGRYELLAAPATLTVRDGQPRLALD